MNGAGGDRFAGPAFAEDQHCGPRIGHALDQVKHPHHLVVAADDVAQAELGVELRPQRAVFFHHLALAQRPLNGEAEFVVDHRLGDVIEGADADRLDGTFDRAVARDQNDGRVGFVLDGPLQQMKTVRVGKADVAEDDLERMFTHPLNRVDAGERGFGPVSAAAEKLSHGLADVLVVVDHQQRTVMGLAHRNTLPATGLPSARWAHVKPVGQICGGRRWNRTRNAGRPLGLNVRSVPLGKSRSGCSLCETLPGAMTLGCANIGHSCRRSTRRERTKCRIGNAGSWGNVKKGPGLTVQRDPN